MLGEGSSPVKTPHATHIPYVSYSAWPAVQDGGDFPFGVR
jgi:hypothetical protein